MANFSNNTRFNSHISRTFNRELEDLRNAVLVMGGEIEVQYQDALEALLQHDIKLAEKVILNDVKINAMEVEIDSECLRILAIRNPTASDLRLVMTVSKMVIELERMGDEIEKIAQFVNSTEFVYSDELKLGITHMAQDVQTILRDTFNAFARQDLKTTMNIFALERLVDEKYNELRLQLEQEIQQNVQHIHYWLDVNTLIRSFERIADRCINLCEYLVYLAGGKDLRHNSGKKIQKKIQALIKS